MIKRLILASLVFSSLLLGAEKSTCYSVQLASYLQKNVKYINSTDYPKECKLLSFGNVKAIRCGCFETRDEVKREKTRLKKRYRRAIIVTTNKDRFHIVKNLKEPVKQKSEVSVFEKSTPVNTPEPRQRDNVSETGFNLNESDSFVATNEDADYHGFEDIPTKLKVLYYIYDSEIGVQGHIDLTAQSYPTRLDDKHKANLLASGELAIDFKKDDFSAYAKIYAQGDSHDMQGKSNKNGRSFLRLDELYATYDFEDDQIMFGRNIRFWGALEVRNITDNFNNQDLRSDPFTTDKLGAWNAAFTHYTETGEISLIVKFYEEDRKMPYFPYAYYPFGDVDVGYNENLQTQESNTRASIYLKWAGTTDTEYALDYAFIYENGYDSQRYYTLDALSFEVSENAYIVNKIMSYNTLVVGSTLIKLEALLASPTNGDVVDTNAINKKEIGDYYHFGLGVEHTLSQVYKDADLGFIAEYYRYGVFEDDKRDDLDLFEVLQNDLFLGVRYSFNEGNDASIIAGGIFDLEYNEEVYYIEYESRIADTFKLKLDYRFIEPSTKEVTAFTRIGRHQRISANLGYYF